MEKIIEQEVTEIKKVHEFYCDICNTKIAALEECFDPDGHIFWFRKSATGYFGHTILLGEHTLNFEKTLCSECAKKEEQRLVDGLKSLGFREGI